ncbi:MAG: hypothetical protein LBB04_00245 [Oscillospiraceae bacterium]|jgi:flagellar basal-body rod protein FlgB|nr:hypothetical protein [Oscillospiraceae bacterium]
MGDIFGGVDDVIAKSWILKDEEQMWVVTENLERSDLPGYKAKTVCFKDEFLSKAGGSREMDEKCLSDMSTGKESGTVVFCSEINQDNSTSVCKDGNNVDKTKEMVDLATLEKEIRLRDMWISGRLDAMESVSS